MTRKYIILRSVMEPTARTRGNGGSDGHSISRPEVDVGELQPRIAASLAQKKFVKAVAPVVPMKLIAPFAVAPSAAAQTGSATWGIQAVRADTSPFTGAGIVVAVLDTGIIPSHPAFAGVEIVRKNFTEAGDDDEHGHGTHCAATIFGREIEGLRIGVAPGVKKALIGKVLGEGGGGSDRVAQAIQWAVSSGAHVISMSLGIDFPGYVKSLETEGVPTELATSMALEGYRANILLFERLAAFIAAQGAFMQPAILIAAAGNESRRDLSPDFEVAASPPSVADGFVSVAAVGNNGHQGFTVAPFSNVGARVAGPGVDIVSARHTGGLVSMSGTSMATPHVAGVAALWAQQLSNSDQLSGQLLVDRLIGTATTTGMSPGVDAGDTGAGLVQAPQG
ncbi:S8 family serine peptidase [Bradyrhizobium sp. CCBAU 51765]|uniref:S8 family peptidase n=1 Tax=Bradyrhizobium sp. CCBAU 51765 TaxID=1325102 RepID=UPI001887CB97|nr:S8 family serine peptidase [Bradyrhizobium sp. CCBAU 51765]QOZ09251.1 peptidase S8 [Bradyrhizobium sp. CCBAU 51765]